MLTDPLAAPGRESLESLELSLDAMLRRIHEIVASEALTADDLVEITGIYNNVAYVFLYLEANEEHVDYKHLLHWRDAFHDDQELDSQILSLLLALRCNDEEAEKSRLAYVKQLRDKMATPHSTTDAEAAELLAEAKAIIADTQRNQHALLERLGAVVTTNPASVFYRLVASTPNAATRKKLARAWVARRDARLTDLVNVVDRMVEGRRRQAATSGRTVLAATLEKCSVTEEVVESFLDEYLRRAVASFEVLDDEIGAVTGGDATSDFPYYMQIVSRGARLPLFGVRECLDYIFLAARSVFGLSFEIVPVGNDFVITVAVRDGERDVGRINFDLWDTGRKSASANHTLGIRNRTDWTQMVQLPVAYVCCRFQHDATGAPSLTFQNVHSLFHEFGHAINHLLIRKRISNQSGLEYLPLERLEHLSMWCEKWVYRPEFALAHGHDDDARVGVAVCQRVKALEYQRTYVERAVAAALDFDLHRRRSGGLAESFAALDERFAVSRFCSLGDFPAYFTWPMFQANPGANFAYLFGAADSSQKFCALDDMTFDAIAERVDGRAMFAACLDFDLPTEVPDSAAVFSFYGRLATSGATTGTPVAAASE